MQGLSFGNQSQRKRPGTWIIPVVLLVVAVLLITVAVRSAGTGPLAAIRTGVQTVTNPIEGLCSGLSAPFKAIGGGSRSSLSDEDVAALQQQNQQLTTLVAELEEYRQQDQRLTTLLKLSDTYGLKTVSASVIGQTGGWDQTATINVGSSAGIQVGMGVMSSCGLYGQVETVTANTSVVRLVTDANSSVSAMIQSTRVKGILKGSYDGGLTLEYITVDKTVGEGDVVMTSGEGGSYPRGIIIGTVKSVEPDSSKLYYKIVVTPIIDPLSCEEVLVLTGGEDSTKSLLNTSLLASITPQAATATNTNTNTSTGSSSSSTSATGTTGTGTSGTGTTGTATSSTSGSSSSNSSQTGTSSAGSSSNKSGSKS